MSETEVSIPGQQTRDDNRRVRRSAIGPAAAVGGAGVIVLLIELARSGALEQYKDLLAPVIGWGPGLFVLAGFLWLAQSYLPPMIATQRETAQNLARLAHAVEGGLLEQRREIGIVLQVMAKDISELKTMMIREIQKNPPPPGAQP